MKQKQLLFALICVFSVTFEGVGQTKKELKLFKEIYRTTINYHFRYKIKPFYFVLPNETVNKELPKIDFAEYKENARGNSMDFTSDSAWIEFFKEADEKRKTLIRYTLPEIDSLDSIAVRFTTKDSLDTVMSNGGFWGTFQKTYGWAKGYLELSNVILSKKKDKAIIEINHHGGNDIGVGMLYLLKKDKNGKWTVVGGFNLWVA